MESLFMLLALGLMAFFVIGSLVSDLKGTSRNPEWSQRLRERQHQGDALKT